MCESNAYMKKNADEELLMADVSKLTALPEGKVRLETILGDEKVVDGSVAEVDFESHRILIRDD